MGCPGIKVTVCIQSGQFSIHYATQRNHVTAIELYSGACRTNDERAAVLNCQDKVQTCVAIL